jgi:hypothetical protein
LNSLYIEFPALAPERHAKPMWPQSVV